MNWHDDWPRAKRNLIRWWDRQDLAFCLLSPRVEPIAGHDEPTKPDDDFLRWTDPTYRRRLSQRGLAITRHAAEAVCFFDTQIGPGSLATFIGATPHFAPSTVWYEPCIAQPDAHGSIRFDANDNRWLDVHLALIDEGLRHAADRYLVGIPDLIENMDTLAALRGNEALLMDLVERPAWVERSIWEINDVYFKVFDLMHARVKDADGGNAFAAFRIWGPGKTAKVQCDFSCMISERMFRQFVVPALRAQCDWLDYPLYHLDGVNAIRHLDALLEIESLRAIQWQPGAGQPNAGHAHWHDLLRRIKAGGKGVQVGCVPDQVIAMLDTIGPEGTFISCRADSPRQADDLLARVDTYRTASHNQEVAT